MNDNQAHRRIDYTGKDYASLRESLLELAGDRLPEWTDHSPNDLGIVLLELFAYMGDLLLYYQDRIANESYLETAVERRSLVNLLRLIGCELRPPKPAAAELQLRFEDVPADSEPGPARPELVVLVTGAEFRTSAEATGTPVHFRYLGPRLQYRLDALPLVQHEGQSYRSLDQALPVLQVDEIRDNEVFGSSDGSPLQRFVLALAPIIDSTLEVRVGEGDDKQLWERQETLLHSGRDDRHYLVRRDETDKAWIEFGDGRNGKVPERGHNNLTARYAVGGGAIGNVPAETITHAVTNIEHLVNVSSPSPATGGADREALSAAARRGPRYFRSQDRAVTVADYEAHARAFGVGKVRARARNWNRIQLFVAPLGGRYSTDTFKRDLQTYLEDRRMIGTIVEVRDPVYVAVELEGTIDISPNRIREQVVQQVQDAVHALFAFDRVDFEATLYLSKVYEVVGAVPGVDGVYIRRFAIEDGESAAPDDALDFAIGAGEALPPGGVLRLGWDQIPWLAYPEGIRLRDPAGGSRAV